MSVSINMCGIGEIAYALDEPDLKPKLDLVVSVLSPQIVEVECDIPWDNSPTWDEHQLYSASIIRELFPTDVREYGYQWIGPVRVSSLSAAELSAFLDLATRVYSFTLRDGQRRSVLECRDEGWSCTVYAHDEGTQMHLR